MRGTREGERRRGTVVWDGEKGEGERGGTMVL